MEKVRLEDVFQRLDRLEQMVLEVNRQLSWIIRAQKLETSIGAETAAAMQQAREARNDKEDAHIVKETLDRLWKKMGIPPDFDPGSIEELRDSMRQSGIRAEDNEFSRAIIAEREK